MSVRSKLKVPLPLIVFKGSFSPYPFQCFSSVLLKTAIKECVIKSHILKPCSVMISSDEHAFTHLPHIRLLLRNICLGLWCILKLGDLPFHF